METYICKVVCIRCHTGHTKFWWLVQRHIANHIFNFCIIQMKIISNQSLCSYMSNSNEITKEWDLLSFISRFWTTQHVRLLKLFLQSRIILLHISCKPFSIMHPSIESTITANIPGLEQFHLSHHKLSPHIPPNHLSFSMLTSPCCHIS